MNSPRGGQLLTIVHKLKHLNFPSALGLMPPSEMMLLAEIAKMIRSRPEKPVTASDIARQLEVSAPAVSRTLNRLEEKHFIERLAHPGDRRNVRIVLTDEGGAAVEENMNKVKAFLERALLHLSDGEIAEMSALFEKLFEAMKAELGNMEQDKENGGLC